MSTGSEVDLEARGLISAGAMTGARARMLLRMLLAAGAPVNDIGRAFQSLGCTGAPVKLLDGRLTVSD